MRQDSEGAPQYYVLDENQIVDYLALDYMALKAPGVIKKTLIEDAPEDTNTLRFEDLSDVFIGIEAIWKSLDISVYSRWFGDAEHIILIGTDPKTNRIRAIYIN